MQRDDYFAIWFPFGVLLGASFSGLAMLYAGTSNLTKFLTDYQIMIGVVIAMGTAVWTIKSHIKTSKDEIEVALRTASEQIRASQLIEESRREEKLRAARAMLPFALTEIIAFCQGTVADLSALLVPVRTGRESKILVVMSAGPTFTRRPVPISALDRMRDLIEAAPREIAAEMGRLLSNVQIYNSRLSDVEKWNESGFSGEGKHLAILERVADLFELYAQANRFFDYGRLKTDSVKLGATEHSEVLGIESAVMLIRDHEKLEVITRKHFPSGSSIEN
jgi:hypothetical protein